MSVEWTESRPCSPSISTSLSLEMRRPKLELSPSFPLVTRSRNKDGNIQLNDYSVLSHLGQGSSGRVVLVMHLPTSTCYAMKVVPHDRSATSEFRILNNLRHPHIVSLHDVMKTPSRDYIIVEYLSGGPVLQSQTSADGKVNFTLSPVLDFSLDTMVVYMAQLLDALAYIHSAGYSHGDIKPSNVLIKDASCLKLADFGEAAPLDEPKGISGTPAFLSPESRSRVVDPTKADVWALGVTFYLMLFRKHPFPNGPPDRHETVNVDIPSGVGNGIGSLLQDMLQVNPATRPSAAQLSKHPLFMDMALPVAAVGRLSRVAERVALSQGDEYSTSVDADSAGAPTATPLPANSPGATDSGKDNFAFDCLGARIMRVVLKRSASDSSVLYIIVFTFVNGTWSLTDRREFCPGGTAVGTPESVATLLAEMRCRRTLPTEDGSLEFINGASGTSLVFLEGELMEEQLESFLSQVDKAVLAVLSGSNVYESVLASLVPVIFQSRMTFPHAVSHPSPSSRAASPLTTYFDGSRPGSPDRGLPEVFHKNLSAPCLTDSASSGSAHTIGSGSSRTGVFSRIGSASNQSRQFSRPCTPPDISGTEQLATGALLTWDFVLLPAGNTEGEPSTSEETVNGGKHTLRRDFRWDCVESEFIPDFNSGRRASSVFVLNSSSDVSGSLGLGSTESPRVVGSDGDAFWASVGPAAPPPPGLCRSLDHSVPASLTPATQSMGTLDTTTLPALAGHREPDLPLGGPPSSFKPDLPLGGPPSSFKPDLPLGGPPSSFKPDLPLGGPPSSFTTTRRKSRTLHAGRKALSLPALSK